MNQVKTEALNVWDIIHEFYGAFNIPLRVRLSLRDPAHPENYLGNAGNWDAAESILRDIIAEKKVDAIDGLGEAAFYGPKLDFMGRDAIGREHQVATIQLDMNMPERFDLTCTNEKGEKERVVMIHCAIMGSIERFMAVLIEHTAGAFPLWLAPVQVAILPISDKHGDAARALVPDLLLAGIRVHVDDAKDTIGKKIRESEKMKVPYAIILGDKDISAGVISVRKRGGEDLGQMALDQFISHLKKEVAAKA